MESSSRPVNCCDDLGHFLVIRGGFSGVETTGALADTLRHIAAYYPRVSPSDVKVTLLQNIDRLLPEMSLRLGNAESEGRESRGALWSSGQAVRG